MPSSLSSCGARGELVKPRFRPPTDNRSRLGRLYGALPTESAVPARPTRFGTRTCHSRARVRLPQRDTTMKHVKLTLGALLATFALSACDSGGAEYAKKVGEFADKACACKDSDCTTKVAKEQADWLTANAEKASKLSSEDAEAVTASSTKLAECTTKIITEAATAAMPK